MVAAQKKSGAKKPAKSTRVGGRQDTASRDVVCQQFAIAYLRYGNATRAFREAVPLSQASTNTAHKEAHLLLHDPRTQAWIEKLRSAACEKAVAQLSEWIFNELRLVRFDQARLFDDQGNLLPIHEIDPDTRFCLESIELEDEKVEVRKAGEDSEIVTRTRVKRIKAHSKHQAQDRLGRYLGAYQRDNDQKSETYEQLLRALHGLPDAG